jgi:hypothetical protein
MAFRTAASTLLRRALLLAGCLAILGVTHTQAAKKGYIKKLTVDPNAPQVGLFEGIDEGAIDVKMVAKNAQGGNLLVENKTDETLTVEMPAGFVGVPVMAQFDDGGFGGDAGGGGGGGGGQQAVGGGGGLGGGGLGGGLGGGGGGFFSIPPEKTALVPYGSVCLEHGKAEPHPRSKYKLMPIEEYTENATLQELIKLVGTGKIHPNIAQPAAWHIANDMSWQQLAALKYDRIGVPDTPQFSRAQLFKAQELVSLAVGKTKAAQSEDEDPPSRTSRVSRVR